MIKVSPAEIAPLSQYIQSISGIYLDHSKAYLLETRLGSLVKKNGCSTYVEYCEKAKNDATKTLEKEIIDAISTNETLFFRDKSPFELLRHKILPDLIAARTNRSALRSRIKIWSAASSTGQELYSIAIILRELFSNNKNFSFSLLGTDISDSAITQASYGKYNKFEIERGLDKKYLHKYFTETRDSWKIKDEIRKMVQFKKLNLIHPITQVGRFDIIFCRNVAIYFTLEDRKKLFDKLAGCLADDGCLIIGSTESLTGICPKFEAKNYLKSIYYQKKQRPS